ncbi:MAG: hypothetical protein M3P94_06115 [Chloroflexota bacterium]|nr:hypothetical protein [Chloroflexota bacterium]
MHHVQREQRTFLRLVTLAAILVALVLVPLMLSSELRLSTGHRLALVPDDAERLFGEDDRVELVVLVRETPNPFSGPSREYTAAYAAEWLGEQIRLHDLATGEELVLPLRRYDLISGAADLSALLFVDEQARGGRAAVLVTRATGEVRVLGPGEREPAIPGRWDEEISFGNIGCSGVSPGKARVACIEHGGSRLVFGDWELSSHPFGRSDQRAPLYRGRGSDPVVGWSPDGTSVYFQNEFGLWRSDLDGE